MKRSQKDNVQTATRPGSGRVPGAPPLRPAPARLQCGISPAVRSAIAQPAAAGKPPPGAEYPPGPAARAPPGRPQSSCQYPHRPPPACAPGPVSAPSAAAPAGKAGVQSRCAQRSEKAPCWSETPDAPHPAAGAPTGNRQSESRRAGQKSPIPPFPAGYRFRSLHLPSRPADAEPAGRPSIPVKQPIPARGL